MKKLGIFLLIALIAPLQLWAKTKCVNIYYDRTDDPTYWMGKTYATFTQNLLGHFPEYQQRVSPIELYEEGEVDQCEATIYLGSYFNNNIPEQFKKDVVNATSNVAWLGYNIWMIDDYIQKELGYKYEQMSSLNKQKVDSKNRPSFYKDIHYKGEVFFKYGEWSKNIKDFFNAPFEQTLFTKVAEKGTQILATAENPVTKERAPYILRKKNFFYVADIPLSFMHEADRFLVYSDVLFDILNAKPRHNGKYAFLRIEDVHALVQLEWLYKTNEILIKEKVPINISLIPIFFDPLYEFDRREDQEFVSMDKYRPFITWINDVKKAGGNFIWHGVTHQYARMANPHTGASGDDFEFFDAVNNRPIKEDSVPYVLNKLEDGLQILKKVGIRPRIWLMPHYQASPLDYIIFGETFSWNVGRAIYYNFKAEGLNKTLLRPSKVTGEDERLWYEKDYADAKNLRANYFKNLKVTYDNMIWSGQMFPYEIYGDVHGQRLIPENLGNSQPFVNDHVTAPRSKEDIIADAKRNLVLRDAWASFFYHPFLFTSYENGGRGAYPGDAAELEYIIRNIKKLGYKFIDINDFMNKNTNKKRPEPIYKERAL